MTRPAPQKAENTDAHTGISVPLRDATFRRIWSTSLLSNLGQQMQAVAAAWTMLQLTQRADLVALVQTAAMLPVMLLALAAGALADMYDKRKVALLALCLAFTGAGLLAFFAATDILTPPLILLGVFVTGAGISLYSPAWQASVVEIVGPRALPAAISLYAMSSNAARSVGPAIGGIIIAALGASITFGINALLYLPIIVALLVWKRPHNPPRLPPERIDRAMWSGVRYLRHSPSSRLVIARAFFTAAGGAAIYSLLPLVSSTLLDGTALIYGILLGGFGLGAVICGTITSALQNRYSPETLIVTCSMLLAAALLVLSISGYVAVSCAAAFIAGGAWMVSISTYNVSIQLASPRWVSGRTLAAFQACTAGGLALGAALWGVLADSRGVAFALLIAGGYTAATGLFGLIASIRKPHASEPGRRPERDPLIQMDLTGRSGPIVIEIEHRVPNDKARSFYFAMRDVRRSRERNGAYGCSLMRDISDPEVWNEKFLYATWNDYLRARDRPTVDDRAVRDRALEFHDPDTVPRVQRYLERPTGSVRWSEGAIDPGDALPRPVGLTALSSH